MPTGEKPGGGRSVAGAGTEGMKEVEREEALCRKSPYNGRLLRQSRLRALGLVPVLQCNAGDLKRPEATGMCSHFVRRSAFQEGGGVGCDYEVRGEVYSSRVDVVWDR